MSAQYVKRKLTAILSADVEGYSRLITGTGLIKLSFNIKED